MEKLPLFSLMEICLEKARKAAEAGEVPVGALIYSTDTHKPLTEAFNLKETLPSALGHAEILAIHKGSRKVGAWRLKGYSMLVTLEPCVMCYGALVQSRIDGVLWATNDPKGGAESAFGLHSQGGHNHSLHFEKANLGFEEKSSEILRNFFKLRRK